MPNLEPVLRKSLEKIVVKARTTAEQAASNALERLGLILDKVPEHLSEFERKLRVALRAQCRQLAGNLERGLPLLVTEMAYAHWHRMLFAAFLAENNLLMHPSNVAVTLEDCRELARDENTDPWVLAASYASLMLPGIFRGNDPALQLRFAQEDMATLEDLLDSIPKPAFKSDDGLGWVYQFWQTNAKESVNKSGCKISGADISPVTQLFTEHYMVEFLLHNTLGAWWASKHPNSPIVPKLNYLRYLEDGTPASGAMAGFPSNAASLRLIDPCCGSGHFLVASLELLSQMRAEEEQTSQLSAMKNVLQDNIFGLELDPRCTQIAAFALALHTWKHGGYQSLPPLNIACSGIPVAGSQTEWQNVAGNDPAAKTTLSELHQLFTNASDLGSLINPRIVAGQAAPLYSADFNAVQKQLQQALENDKSDDPASAVFGNAAKGIAKAAELLSQQYHLVLTNVPYLARGKQGEVLKQHIERHFVTGKADLATAFVLRCQDFCTQGGVYALVTPQNWLFLNTYLKLRENLLTSKTWRLLGRLGVLAFSSLNSKVASVIAIVLENSICTQESKFSIIEAGSSNNLETKSYDLQKGKIYLIRQMSQLKNPDFAIINKIETEKQEKLLSDYSDCYVGITTGDTTRFIRKFWEIINKQDKWFDLQANVEGDEDFTGFSSLLLWENGIGELAKYRAELAKERYTSGAWKQGEPAWNKKGVLVNQAGSLHTSLYMGALFDSNVAVILPKDQSYLPAIWSFCHSKEFSIAVRTINQKMSVANATLVKVPFDLEHWQRVADQQYPNGLPEPYSNDPTQWLFMGGVAESTAPLQVAVARLLGFEWQNQVLDGLMPDLDGLVCLPAVGGEQAAAERLRALLSQVYGTRWSPTVLAALLGSVGFEGRTLEDWLYTGFFVQHCKLFHNRPFIWHIWDGVPGGFSVLVNYHKLSKAKLSKLIYTVLGAWITRQTEDVNAGVTGAEKRLSAAKNLKLKLEQILIGESPHDIFVRWKPLVLQALGWEPDLNDGVRMNIRPFITADVLRSKFTINWNKDRGTDPKPNAGGTTERHNDKHLTLLEKRAARETVS
jgi:hypothetical protein